MINSAKMESHSNFPLFVVLFLALNLVIRLPIAESISFQQRVTAKTISKTYTLYHDLDGSGNFIQRSVITLSDNSASTNEATAVSSNADISTMVENLENCLDISSIDILLSNNGLYRLKLTDNLGNTAVTSVSSCAIRRAQFREKLEIIVNPTGDLLSFSVTPLISPLAPSCGELQPLSKLVESGVLNEDALTFKSQVSVEGAIPAISVPLVLPTSRPPPGE